MFLVDVSSSMDKIRRVEVPGPQGPVIIEMTNLMWSLQYVMLKIQEMVGRTVHLPTKPAATIFNGRKTDQCGVILFGTEGTNNIINAEHGGYEHVTELIPVQQPNHSTLSKLAALEASSVVGDPIDALIVGIEVQDRVLEKKRTWTRKIVLLTDGESPMEVEDWQATVEKMNGLSTGLTVVGIDFDDDDLPFHEEDKSNIKKENESFYKEFTEALQQGVVGNCDYALSEISRPDVKQVKSAMLSTVLRIGDTEARDEEAIEIQIKTSKATALARPKSWKRFARRKPMKEEDEDAMDEDEPMSTFAQLRMRTDYILDRDKGEKPEAVKSEENEDEMDLAVIPKEELVRGYKYGASFAPAPDGGFPRLETRKGIDICGFFQQKNFRREMAMGEVSYIWGDPTMPMQQVALSGLVQGMYQKGAMAIARWVSRDNMDPKMGVLYPCPFQDADALMWVQVAKNVLQMPFADDVRNYSFASLETLVNKKGEVVKEHPYLPTEEQMDAMEAFVDAMDLSDAGEKNEEGEREPWFDTRLSYNPAIHRTKQALFHGAVVPDLNTHPLPPPHPELLKYFEPPRRVLKRARRAIEDVKKAFNVREVPKKARVRKDEHKRVEDEDDEMLLLDAKPGPSATQRRPQTVSPQSKAKEKTKAKAKPVSADSGSETEEEPEDEELLLGAAPTRPREGEEGSVYIDPKRAPGRIVGESYPLRDFKKNVARGDVVSKAVEDLGVVIKTVVTKPFVSRRTAEMLECMDELRKVALEEDEIDAWNEFIQDLRDICMSGKRGAKDFWDAVRGVGRPLSFITSSEASKAGGKSQIAESEAAMVRLGFLSPIVHPSNLHSTQFIQQ
ncbi:SPOC domain-like protein [Epithele typhae]|uniref:SPOC domain-like protein n=1 Tax=Epithele typhae TaxID=378194 RepID=UPI002007B6D4|nr:SPOC domain-like protein [Epithele typhae]KAH9938974.1 SPOC domain-like protein [Epithele typhae]